MKAVVLLALLAGQAFASIKRDDASMANVLAALAQEAVQSPDVLESAEADTAESLVLPSAAGQVELSGSLLAEYGQQSLAPIRFGPRPDHSELTLGVLPPCCGTCSQGYRRGYCTFWWTGCGWGTPLYHAHGCCGSYCTCCFYGYLFPRYPSYPEYPYFPENPDFPEYPDFTEDTNIPDYGRSS